MRLISVLNSPWAIMPEKLLEISDIYARYLRGEDVSVPRADEDDDDEDPRERRSYQILGSVGILPIHGTLAKRMNVIHAMSGGTSTQMMQRDIAELAGNPAVKAIVLSIDSPGGTVDGTQAMADAVFEARKSGKPIYAVADGVMASAAYWIGSAANKVYIADDTTRVGSIGVVATHVDTSKQAENEGIKVTEITAGKYKRIASQHEPLTDEGRKGIQEQVDHIYSVFVKDVARNRGVDIDTVLNKMADGKIFMGQDAIKAGLADGKMSLADLVTNLVSEGNRPMGDVLLVPNVTASTGSDSVNMTITAVPAGTEAAPEKVEEKEAAPAVAPVPQEPEKKEETATPEPASAAIHTPAINTSEGDKMLEGQVRELLKLGASDNIEEALRAAAKTREVASGNGENAVVSLFDYNVRLERIITLERNVAEKDAEIARMRDEHTKELRRRDAAALVGRAVEEGKITPFMAQQWGNEMAFNDPAGFTKVLASMPRMVRIGTEEGSGVEVVGMSAAEQARQAVAALREEYRAAGKTVPTVSELQQEVFRRDEKLAQDYLNEVRGI